MKQLLLPLLSILFFASCNHYESDVPIQPSNNSQIEEELLGEWILSSEKKDDKTSGFIEVIAFNDHEYLVQVKEYADSTKLIQSIVNIRMFSTQINGNTYFNLQLIGAENDNTFMIYRIKPISGNRHKLFYLSKDQFTMEFKDSDNFMEYIKNHFKEFDKAFEAEGILSRKTK